ncbi:SDR family NAD(P)-dependent oxidoreductase [Sphaerisporangium corydalis]|uniref:SDR family NAD(P)-dependent oxidoreductase n=1 Tax=Sphaerisporangium corydalis TaxID=1441875 RepID=A0ABV9ENS7_9ACTN|nr:SDR family NAD(P)-dependent oxidoreductase [Sphaerisporangium corydalis]
MGRLDGKVAIITGGEGSLGVATARVFVAEGARVMLVGLDLDRLQEAVIDLDGHIVSRRHRADGAASYIVGDVTDPAQVRAAVRATVERYGGLDVLFSNAGIAGVVAPVTDYPDDVFDRVLAVHVRGAFLLCKHALPVMSDGGSVIITSSVVGLTSDAGVSAYAAAKHAQVGLMRTLAKEVAHRGIRVNTIHPGPVDNTFQRSIEVAVTGASPERAAEMFDGHIPLRRHASPNEIARAVLFLAGDDSSFVTGSPLRVDGGMSI